MEIEGKMILDLGETGGVSRAGNNWRKHEYVLETMGQYPKKVKFHVFGDRVDNMRFELGKAYKLQVDVESREFNGRWYTDINCFQSQEAGALPEQNPYAQAPGYQAPQPFPQQPQAPAPAPFAPAESDATDDLPF